MGNLKSLRREIFDRILSIVKINTMKRQPQIAALINKVHGNAALHAWIDDLRKGDRRSIGVPRFRGGKHS